jgi:hypothetical protein
MVAPGNFECCSRIVSIYDLGNTSTHEGHVEAHEILYDGTPDCGWMLKPNCKWDGSIKHKFIVSGLSDSDCAKDLGTRQSVTVVLQSSLKEHAWEQGA